MASFNWFHAIVCLVNLAMAISLNEQNSNVGILDADIYGPSIPKMMMLEGSEPCVNDKNHMIPLVNYGVKCMSIGFLVDSNSAIVWRGPMVMSAIHRMLRQVEWSPLDYLIIDMPPGTGDIQLSISQHLPVTGAVIVTTPQDVALADVRRGVEMFRKVDIPVVGIVENMSQFICPHCEHISHIFGQDGTQTLAKELQVNIIGNIPIDMKIRQTSDDGVPIVLADSHSKQSEAYRAIAEKLVINLPNR